MKKVAILGASGHGKVIADLAELLGYSISFFDAGWPLKMSSGRWKVIGGQADLVSSLSDFSSVLVAIGDNRTRSLKQAELSSSGARISTMIHPSSEVSRYVDLGAGSVVFANATINVDALLGAGVIVNTGATIDHDCRLGDFVHISPGAHLAGNVTIGDRSWVGIGACVRQGITIGNDVVVGAGAAVVSDIPSGARVVGVPARPM